MGAAERIPPILVTLILIFAALVPTNHSAATATEDVTISYAFTSPGYSLHEPVILRFSLHNDLRQPIRLDLGRNYKEHFLITVTSPNGSRVAVPPLRAQGAARTGLVTLEGGGEFKQNLVLNEWIKFETIGRYEIEIRLAEPVQSPNGNPLPDAAQLGVFHGSVEVTPEDPNRLASVCDLLANRVEESSSFEQAWDAALALSFIDDPIAVPYLRKVLHAKRGVEFAAIDGLERIADPSSVASLISALSMTDDPSTPLKARSALQRIAAMTTDPAEQQSIRDALAK